jgi:hypothetical protein
MLDLEGALIRLVAIEVSSGERKVFYSSNERIVNAPSWLADGSGVVGLIREQATNFSRNQIGFVSYPKGVYSSITRDTNSYSDLSVAASGHTFLQPCQTSFAGI